MTQTAPAPSSLGRLGRELHTVCVTATQPEEIAAALEAHGLNDDLAREQYGLPSVFACAEALFAHLPYRAPVQTARPTTPLAWATAPRGLLYALPGAALAVAGPLLEPYAGAQTALLVSVVFGWGWGQGLASIGYRKTGEPLREFLRDATLATFPVAGAVGALSALLTHQPIEMAAAVAAIAGGSFAAFAALLVLGRAFLATLVYLPALAALLVGPHLTTPDPAGAWAAVGCAALLPLFALADQSPLPRGLQLPLPAWPVTLGHALSGWTCALFVTFVFGAPLWTVMGPGAILPVIVSVGAMEVLSLRFYSQLYPMARRQGELLRLAGQALRTLSGAVLLYLLALAALLGLYLLAVRWVVPAALSGMQADPAGALQMAGALMVYGAAMLLGTVISNVGRPWFTSTFWLLGTLMFVTSPLTHLLAAPLMSSLVVLVLMTFGTVRVLLVPATYR